LAEAIIAALSFAAADKLENDRLMFANGGPLVKVKAPP
jgi:hypothetical protein